MITIERINLFSDWVKIAKLELEQRGYSLINQDNESISIKYFNLLKRSVPVKKRNILKSDIFECPNSLKNGLELFQNKILNGEDIFSHLSTKLKNLDEVDYLLYDWGIFHFHLGTELRSDGFVNRTGSLLFAFYDENNFYFLNVMPHGSWSRQDMLKAIHRNWPKTIEQYKLKNNNIIGLEHNVSDEEVVLLRNANVNVFIEVEPKVIYSTPGGGFVSSGHSYEVIENHLTNQRNLINFENSIKANPYEIIGENISLIKNEKLIFEMVKYSGKHYLNELNNNFHIPLN